MYMKSLLKINLVLLFLASFTAVQAQVDIKVNPTGLLFSRAMVSAEFGIKDNFGLEATGGVGWPSVTINDEKFKSNTVRYGLNGRYYFSPNKGLDRFYAGLYSRFVNGEMTSTADDGRIKRNRASGGFLIGYKIVANNEHLVVDFGLGLGRTFTNKFTPDSDGQESLDLSDIPFLNIDAPLFLTIGYRF